MQYACMKVSNDKMVLIDASELHSLQQYKDAIHDVPYDEAVFEYKIVYGAYLIQRSIERDKGLTDMIAAKEYGLGHIKDDHCITYQLCDIEPILDKSSSNRIPFAALLKTSEKIGNQKTKAISLFLRYVDLSPASNIINRSGIFAVKDQERRVKTPITIENWRNHMDLERAVKCASMV